MFRRISVLLALQFTAFVTLLMLINGIIFVAADYRASRRMMEERMLDTAQRLVQRSPYFFTDVQEILTLRERGTVRILDARGDVLYSGNMFASVPFDRDVQQFSDFSVQGERLHILTTPIIQDSVLVGYLQIAMSGEFFENDLIQRIINLLFITAGVSLVTFVAGLFVAKRSLKPAEESMRKLEQFTQDASHELRTPLATLGSSLDLALKTKNYHEGILSAKDDLKRISTLVERLLELTRLDKPSLERRRTDLTSLLHRVVEEYGSQAEEKKVKIETRIMERIEVEGDEMLLMQLFGNLLSNAIKFTPRGGTVSVTLDKRSCSIADTGVGIPPDALASIFERFYQADTSRANGGFGLGLALVKRIADLHGWSVEVESEEGKGSTFVVRFHTAGRRDKMTEETRNK